MVEPWLEFDRIREGARFETVLEYYRMKLTGRGLHRYILCPFRREKTPSCSIDLTRRRFHCFGCGAKGTVIKFVAMLDRCSLREAAAKIAALCAIGSKEAEH